MRTLAKLALAVPFLTLFMASSAEAGFVFRIDAAHGPGVQNGLGTTTAGGIGNFNLQVRHDGVGSNVLNSYSVTLLVPGAGDFRFGGATSTTVSANPNSAIGTSFETLQGVAFNNIGTGPSTVNVTYDISPGNFPTANGVLTPGDPGDNFLVAIPEPSTLCLLGSVVGGVCLRRRRRA